jgi:tetratricopeptide (TPR) repeat protein
MAKSKRKKQRRQKLKRSKPTSRGIPGRLYDALSEAERLDRQGKWVEARELLEDLDRSYPDRAEVLAALVSVYYELGDLASQQHACQRLIRLRPDDPDVCLMLAGSCLTNVRPALALGNFRRFLRRWPNDVRAAEVRKTVAFLEEQMEEMLQDLGLCGEEGLQMAALHEEVLGCLEHGEYDLARQAAEQLLKQYPSFCPAINNLGEAHFREGRIEEALAAARRVLQQDPDNFHALANLARYLCLSGRAEEAQAWAQQLKSVESKSCDVWIKKAETFTCLGDHEEVLRVFAGAQQSRDCGTDPNEAMLSHLAAVAAMRLGREKEARTYWKRALKLEPGLDVAKDNLQDLKKPVGQRHGPWPFGLNQWIPRQLAGKLLSRLSRAEHRTGEQALARETRRFLQDHPLVTALLPVLLDRGDPEGRQFALRIAILAETPQTLAALRDFALSQRGPDQLRQQAAQALREAGMLPAGLVRLWIKGQWSDILLLSFEIHREPKRVHQPQVEDLAREAMAALENDDAQEAEHLLKQALDIEPDALDLLNNLAGAYRLQGRREDWKPLIREIHRRDPDYLFGRINMALYHLDEGNLQEARDMLTPLLSRPRFHLSEFVAMSQAQIELCQAEGHLDAARLWLKMWEDVDPDHPDLKHCQRRLGVTGLWDSLAALVRR